MPQDDAGYVRHRPAEARNTTAWGRLTFALSRQIFLL
jgi:hypothetical protein